MQPQFKLFRFLILGLLFCFTSIIAAETQPQWPVSIDSNQGQIIVYQPQPESLQGNTLTGRAAVAVQKQGQTEPVYGAFWFTAQIATDLDKNTYDLQQIKITKIKFSEATPQQTQTFTGLIGKELTGRTFQGSLDTLKTGLEREQMAVKADANLQTTPPKIIFAPYPAVLVVLDGEPRLQPIEDSKLMRVANTPMLMVFDPTVKKYYLSSGSVWYATSDIHGNWSIEHNPPAYIASIVTEDGKAVPNAMPDAQMPKIIVSTEPAELISSDGTPQYSPIKDTDLLYMSNSDNNVFLNLSTQEYYVLFTGRWFTSKSLQGPWTFVAPDKLPPDFAKIPADSPKASVLASVANTPEAEDALIQSQIPQTAAVKRSEAKLEVDYNGKPKFKAIRGTKIKYAVNTTTPVLLINGRYYAVDNAVWFVSDSPNGPWVVADAVPAEVQGIPPDSPVYNVKYVYVYDSTPDVVYVGYTPGYLGFFPFLGTVVFGTGFYYPYWYDNYYYPWPWTYGLGIYYSNFYGWGYGGGWGYPFSYVGYGWNSNWWGRRGFGGHGWYGHGGWYGPSGFRHGNMNINRNIRFGNQINIGKRSFKFDRNINNNIYRRPGNSQRLMSTGLGKGKLGGVKQSGFAKGKPNNVFADKSGNIFRQGKGGLEMNKGKHWEKVGGKPGGGPQGITKGAFTGKDFKGQGVGKSIQGGKPGDGPQGITKGAFTGKDLKGQGQKFQHGQGGPQGITVVLLLEKA